MSDTTPSGLFAAHDPSVPPQRRVPSSVPPVPAPRSGRPQEVVGGLRRRVPQAHLAAELRAPTPTAAAAAPTTAEAARAVGLDVGPMSGFDRDKVDAAFFFNTNWRSNVLVNIGFGDSSKVFSRLPRLAFDEACQFV